jgi:uncharacterized membrane protein
MASDFSLPVEKIVGDYLRRLRTHLKGFPEKDQDELAQEVYSHIYESYANDPAADEIDRILSVLGRLGEPEAVVADRIAASMVGMGRKKKLPLYILAGVLVGLFGVPLGIGGFVLVFGLAIAVAGLVSIYYVTAAIFTVVGAFGVLVTVLKWIFPGDMYRFGFEIGLSPNFESLPVRLIIAFLMTGLGLLMFWAGRYLTRGLKFIVNLVPRKIRSYRDRRRLKMTGLLP